MRVYLVRIRDVNGWHVKAGFIQARSFAELLHYLHHDPRYKGEDEWCEQINSKYVNNETKLTSAYQIPCRLHPLSTDKNGGVRDVGCSVVPRYSEFVCTRPDRLGQRRRKSNRPVHLK